MIFFDFRDRQNLLAYSFSLPAFHSSHGGPLFFFFFAGSHESFAVFSVKGEPQDPGVILRRI